jgi:peptidoglycan/xylan/chitin deacetylase (PgdA/CDA1 family)
MNPVSFAAQAKGLPGLTRRVRSIIRRYGLTPAKMDQALQTFAQTLKQFDCGASFAIPAIVLERNRLTMAKYLDRNIEFVVHGYAHIDYSRLAFDEQIAHLRRAQATFVARGIQATGFRSPYLRCSPELRSAAQAAGFAYTSQQSILWDVLGADALPGSAGAGYIQRIIAFYTPWLASERPSLPHFAPPIVEIPVSLPDDEMLVDRLGNEPDGWVETIWRRILAETYRRGELFTIQLHPERIAWCAKGLAAVLAEARSLSPAVWIARMDEIAAWWRSRAEMTYAVVKEAPDSFRLAVNGPAGTTILARSVAVEAPTDPWSDGYRRVRPSAFVFRAEKLPFVGLSPAAPSALIDFLRQQGFLVENGADARSCAVYLDPVEFTSQDERQLLAQLEEGAFPLLRVARWPGGARSALSITGDIDALTLWDYGLRMLGS